MKYLFLLTLLITPGCYSEKKSNLIFLSIGIENYANLEKRKETPKILTFSNTPSGKHSAERVAYSLAQRGAKWGMLLTNQSSNDYITSDDIFEAVSAAIKETKKVSNPTLVIYYNGHGIGEGQQMPVGPA